MAKQDRSGSKYEKLLAYSLDVLRYDRNTDSSRNYLQPPKNAEIVINGIYIQPDFVVRFGETVKAVLYATHWSNTRSSKYKFWRTWEEQAQQRVAVGDSFLAVNFVFEALPAGSKPMLCFNAGELPLDPTRSSGRPIQLEGWDPGIGWALIESFDINILFPKGYAPIAKVNEFDQGDLDAVTTALLRRALGCSPKRSFRSQWNTLRAITSAAPAVPRSTPTTASRYRIGLLHVYLLCRVLEKRSGKTLPVPAVVETLIKVAVDKIELSKLRRQPPFDQFTTEELGELLDVLASVFVRKGSKPEGFCTIRRFSAGANTLKEVMFNHDLKLCVADLKGHLASKGFVNAIEDAFARFDSAYGVTEAIDDLAFPDTADEKATFVRDHLLSLAKKASDLASALWSLNSPACAKRKKVSPHAQNWHFEILLYLCGLNSTEDIQTRFKEEFEKSGHKLRPHAPYGGHAQTVAFMLQGRDVCETWSRIGRNRTLTPDAFRELCWRTVAQCISVALEDRGVSHMFSSDKVATTLYLQNKSMRIISSDLNGFYIMIDHFLGDLCYLKFLDDEDQEGEASDALSARIRASWQTDMVKKIWGSAPLETWVEGVSKDGKWLIKVQSSQDGNEGHKTKELAGRCRAMHLEWKPGKDPKDRSKWSFKKRKMPKCALVLDGDWDYSKKKNLYEAGWDWVGDVSQLEELRQLIKPQAE
jgi:hypothetical protein